MTELSALNIRITGDSKDLQTAISAANGDLAKLVAGAQAAGLKVRQIPFKPAAQGAAGLSQHLRGVTQQLSQVGQQTMATGNFLQALAIQLPDIGLAFGAVGTAAGLLAGIALPMVVAAFAGAADAGRTLADAITQVDDALSGTAELAKIAAGDFSSLKDQYGALTTQVLALYQADVQSGLRGLADGARALKEELLEMYNGNAWANVSRAEDLANGLLLGTNASRELANSMNALAMAGSLDQQLEIVSRMRQRFEEMVGPVGQMTQAQFEFWTSLKDSEAAMLRVKQRTIELKGEVFGIVGAAKAAAAAVGSIGSAASAAMPAVAALASKLWEAAQAKADAAMWVEKQQPGGIGDLANQYAQYGAGRAAFNRGAQQGVAFSGATAFGGGSGGGGGGGGRDYAAELAAFEESLMTESELELAQFDLRQTALEEFLAQRVITQQEYQAYMEQIKTDHEQTMGQIEATAYAARLSQTADLFGQLASIAEIGGQKMVKAVAAAKAIEATINAYTAATAALAQPGLTLAGRFAAYASVLAAGLKGVAAIRSAGSGGGGGGGASIGAAAGAGAGSPLQVNLNTYGFGDFISRADFGSMLDKLGEVAGDRGYRIMVPA